MTTATFLMLVLVGTIAASFGMALSRYLRRRAEIKRDGDERNVNARGT